MKRRDLAVVCAGQFLGLAALEAGLCATPWTLAAMGASGDAELAAWSGAAQFAASGLAIAAIPLWGRLGDRVGRARMLARAQAGLGVSLALLAFARTPWQVVFARALQGAFAGTTPAALALVAGGSDGARRMGWVQSATMTGAVAGPLLGGVLAPRVGAPALFLAGAGLCALLAAVSWRVEGAPAAAREARGARPAASYASAASLSFFRSLEDPLLPVLARSLAPASWTALAGACLSASRAVQALSAPWWGKVCERRGAREVLSAASLAAALATAAQAVAPAGPWLLAVRVVLGFFAAGAVAALYASAGASSARGEAVAWTASGLRLGGALAGAGSAALASLAGVPGALVLAGAGVAVASRVHLWAKPEAE